MTRATSPVHRGRQTAPPHLHWRLDGAAEDPAAPLVLALHGWGMDEDFFALLLQKLFPRPMRFLLPRAPFPADRAAQEPEAEADAAAAREQPTEPEPARRGGSWYVYDGDQTRFQRELVRVEGELVALVREVEAKLELRPRRRIVLGFSQGGYCGSWTALRHAGFFSGMAIVGARVKTEFLAEELKCAGETGFRALLLHGERDRSVQPHASKRSRDALAAAGVPVELRTFDAAHSLGRAKVAAIGEWLDALEA